MAFEPTHYLVRLLTRIMKWVIWPVGDLSIEVLLRRSLDQPIPPVNSNLNLDIRFANSTDLPALISIYRKDKYLYLGDIENKNSKPEIPTLELRTAMSRYEERLKRGEKCFIAFHGSKIVHVNWLCKKWGEAIKNHPLYLRCGEVYTTDAYTVTDYRGLNVHAVVLAKMLEFAQAEGAREALTVTMNERIHSFKAFRQLGWQVAGVLCSIDFRHFLGVRLFRLSGNIDPLLRAHGDSH